MWNQSWRNAFACSLSASTASRGGSKSKSGGIKRSKRRKSEESFDEMEEAESRIKEREGERK